jgi:hypothetical protein
MRREEVENKNLPALIAIKWENKSLGHLLLLLVPSWIIATTLCCLEWTELIFVTFPPPFFPFISLSEVWGGGGRWSERKIGLLEKNNTTAAAAASMVATDGTLPGKQPIECAAI